jgi:hypothetical protein
MLIITPSHATNTDEVQEHLAEVRSHADHRLTAYELDVEFEQFISASV